MAGLSPEQLSVTLKHLKRTPAPKVPITGNQPKSPEHLGPIDLSSVKLKKTGKRESLIESDTVDHGKENTANELNSAFEKRRKMFEGTTDSSTKPATLPRVMPKPRRSSEKDGEFSSKPRSGSFPRNNSITDANDNLVESTGPPSLKPLPTLQSIGKPPSKPAKPMNLILKVKKYKNHKVIIAPKVHEVKSEDVQNRSFNQDNAIDDESIIEDVGEEIYDDINTEDTVLFTPETPQNKIPEQIPEEPEPIEEDMYDDVEQLAETVKAELGQNLQPPSSIGDNGEFGDDIYQPVEGTFALDQQGNGVEVVEIDDEYQMLPEEQETPVQPPPPRESKEDAKAKKERERKEKELQKKKEKDEQKRKREEERREREDKKKKEEERRKREKMDKDLKKAHKLKGNEPVLCKGTTKEDISGTGKDLPCTKGSSLEVIAKENCPSGKWLVKDQQGHYGYVNSESLLLEAIPTEGTSEDAENLDEDLYECVETFQSSSQPPPISTLPPPATDDHQEELYDDTVVEDEDLYDDIPGAS